VTAYRADTLTASILIDEFETTFLSKRQAEAVRRRGSTAA
jgi:hypothetical protein